MGRFSWITPVDPRSSQGCLEERGERVRVGAKPLPTDLFKGTPASLSLSIWCRPGHFQPGHFPGPSFPMGAPIYMEHPLIFCCHSLSGQFNSQAQLEALESPVSLKPLSS